MCLGSIGQIVAVHDGGEAIVDADGRRQRALNLTPGQVPLVAGDWVVVHSGFVLGTLTEPEALDALSIRAHHDPPRHGLAPVPDPMPQEVQP